VFENGIEQVDRLFRTRRKSFHGSTHSGHLGFYAFHLWEIKEAAIAFAKQLRPRIEFSS